MSGQYAEPGPRASLGARVRGKLLFVPASIVALIAMRRRARTEVWIGDSHAMSFNRDIVSSMFMRAPEGQLIYRIGARVMWSLAANGFPPRVLKLARFANRFARRGSLVPVFSAGEIDVRAHLVPQLDKGFDFVGAYVEQCRRVAELLKAERSAYIVPPPPCNLQAEDVWYPIVGTLEERLKAFDGLRSALAEAVEQVPGAVLIDATDVLAGPDGGMRLEFTDDGCHTNMTAVPLVRAVVAQHELRRR